MVEAVSVKSKTVLPSMQNGSTKLVAPIFAGIEMSEALSMKKSSIRAAVSSTLPDASRAVTSVSRV